jgi:hypothetical protein
MTPQEHTVAIDDRPFQVQVLLVTGQVIEQTVDPKEIAPRVAAGEFPAIAGRTDREALRTAAYTIFASAVSRDAPGDGLGVFDTEGRTWAIPHQSILAINFRDPVMPREERRTGFRPAGGRQLSVAGQIERFSTVRK